MLKLAGAEGLEPSTVGFGDRCSTIGLELCSCRKWQNYMQKKDKCKDDFTAFLH